jgi:hypothetical protein
MADDIIETTAGQVAAELQRRGISPEQRVTVTIEPDDWLSRARRLMRPRVEAAGWSDEDIDRFIDEARTEVHLRAE